jgi:LmbE family N-acetylglucosaminyl deacetylase
MALIALALPILPGKTPEWRAWMEELKGTRQQEFAESRRAAGVHERTFLQQTPMGDLVIVTLEGDDPGRAFGQMLTATDAFSKWFGEHAMAAHGDLPMPTTGLPSELVADSDWA